MKNKAFKFIIPVFALVLSLTSCKKEKSYWDDNFVAPIAHGGLSLSSLFPDTVIKSNSDSTLKIGFETLLVNYVLDSLLKIPDTTLDSSYVIPSWVTNGIPFGPGQSIVAGTPTDNYYYLKGAQLKYVIIKQGKINITLKNTYRQPIAYQYILNSGTKNNIVLNDTFYVPGGSFANPGKAAYTIDLAGYKVDFTGTTHNQVNTIVQTNNVWVANYAQNDTIYANQGLTDSVSFVGIVPQYAVGYFGNQTINVGPDTTTFDIFKTIKSGMLNLNSASIKLKIENGFGVVMKANVNYLTAISDANAATVSINPANSTPIATPININPAINTGTGSAPSTKTITLNDINTPSLTNFIGILPNKIAYKLSAQINPPPAGNSSLGNDFGYYGTAFKAYMDADIPLWFSASNLALGDTIKFDISNLSQLHNVNRGQLILTATNGYPFSINLQGYLLDENKQQMDVLFASPNTINAPTLDPITMKVIAPLQSKLYIPLSTDKINKIQKAKYIYYKATFNTTPASTQVKFYNYYNLDLLLTADINYTIGK